MNRVNSVVVAVCLLVVGCAAKVKSTDQPPASPREFRAVWVATVTNIDWPSKPGLSTDDQKREIIEILNRCVENRLNAVVLQVRTSCDALYESRIEPWSFYLTGEQGKAPNPYYDPLKFWIDEAHKRGLELHAWFNPYRARVAASKYEFAKSHIVNTQPSAVKKYGNMYWLDPGDEKAAQQSYRVFMDVVRRYDVDGIHIDDYFYPYPVKSKDGGEEPFPDDPSYERYKKQGGTLARDDWRRKNVDDLVKKIHDGTKKQKKWVKFGISPFGLCRPGKPEGTKGFDQYAKLYADAQLWLNEGWCDYWTPQLYWKISHPTVPFEPLLKFWVQENKQNRHVWPGLFTSKMHEKVEPTTAPATQESTDKIWTPQDILDQIQITRQTAGASGNVHFSMNAFSRNSSQINDALTNGPYAQDALVPASTWLDAKPPAAPNLSVRLRGDVVHAAFSPAFMSEKVWVYALHVQYGETWKFRVVPGITRSLELPDDPELGKVTAVSISAVDRCGNESPRTIRAVSRQ